MGKIKGMSKRAQEAHDRIKARIVLAWTLAGSTVVLAAWVWLQHGLLLALLTLGLGVSISAMPCAAFFHLEMPD